MAMAKHRAKEGTPATEAIPRRDKASEAEAQLRAYHALGRMVIDRVRDGRLDFELFGIVVRGRGITLFKLLIGALEI